MKKEITKELEECLIKIGLKIAKRNEGALFVIGKTKYSPLVEQTVPKFKAQKNPKLLESLALMDGAVILDKDGIVKAYGARIESSITYKNHGTRHAAALGASKEKGNICILVSEEDKKIRIFKEGKMIMQIDPKEKNVENSISPATDILETIGAGTLGTIGASILAPSLGITLLPGVVVFGVAHYIGKRLLSKN